MAARWTVCTAHAVREKQCRIRTRVRQGPEDTRMLSAHMWLQMPSASNYKKTFLFMFPRGSDAQAPEQQAQLLL